MSDSVHPDRAAPACSSGSTGIWTSPDGPWTLNDGDLAVTQCRVDQAFSILMASPARSLLLRIEGDFVVTLDSRRHRVSPGELATTDLRPALELLHREVQALVAHPDGRLTASFSPDAAIEVEAGTQYEAWTLTGGDRLVIVSGPDGQLTIWSETTSD